MILRNSGTTGLTLVCAFALTMGVFGQTTISRNKNNPYSPSPDVNAKSRSLKPTEIYKIGVGDVLHINLKNAAQGTLDCTVRPDGTIDFPLAGENLIVADHTLYEIEDRLTAGVTLFPDPQIEVKVREYRSHKITVSGMVENPGEKVLQREAIPLFVIRSQALVYPSATKAVIIRAPMSEIETYDLRRANTGDILIYPGNSIEFTDKKTRK